MSYGRNLSVPLSSSSNNAERSLHRRASDASLPRGRALGCRSRQLRRQRKQIVKGLIEPAYITEEAISKLKQLRFLKEVALNQDAICLSELLE
ncbi:hypothetical protein FCM35_KLT00260 [Carex littledalei]|uniref:Uncharacterized protein n=1 Tax=Carex littledalei TaxID=544730 RepID=A0A833VI62_9POAL|nr:hypothetical protein FCM35_KLT00260 [Carex littledalei]